MRVPTKIGNSMDFEISNEQQLIIDTVKKFVEQELYPYEDEVEKVTTSVPV